MATHELGNRAADRGNLCLHSAGHAEVRLAYSRSHERGVPWTIYHQFSNIVSPVEVLSAASRDREGSSSEQDQARLLVVAGGWVVQYNSARSMDLIRGREIA